MHQYTHQRPRKQIRLGLTGDACRPRRRAWAALAPPQVRASTCIQCVLNNKGCHGTAWQHVPRGQAAAQGLYQPVCNTTGMPCAHQRWSLQGGLIYLVFCHPWSLQVPQEGAAPAEQPVTHTSSHTQHNAAWSPCCDKETAREPLHSADPAGVSPSGPHPPTPREYTSDVRPSMHAQGVGWSAQQLCRPQAG
jgi:hypothetical protein